MILIEILRVCGHNIGFVVYPVTFAGYPASSTRHSLKEVIFNHQINLFLPCLIENKNKNGDLEEKT